MADTHTPAPRAQTPEQIRQVGADAIRTEAAALVQLADALPAPFADAVAAITALEGRVIVSGIGKSGHVGRKIAATLASTGTPAFFLHATEASHGDLGMVTGKDICLLISNSGETAELRDLIYYIKRFDIPMIAISSRADSTLMRAATWPLALPQAPEACSIGLAPTTSTTLTLALGDALAVALIEARGFMREDFGIFHPGGKLGAQMMTAADIMHGGDALPLVSRDADMKEVIVTMTSKGFGMAVLVDKAGRVSGVLTDGDVRRNIDTLMQSRPADLASTTPVTIAPDCLLPEALAIANARKITALLVTDPERRPLGVVHVHDILRTGVM